MDLIEKRIKETKIEIKTAKYAIFEAEKDLFLENHQSFAPTALHPTLVMCRCKYNQIILGG